MKKIKSVEGLLKKVTSLVWKYGPFLLNKKNAGKILARSGLKKSQITPALIHRAEGLCRERLKSPMKEVNEDEKWKNTLSYVWEGDPELDNQLNPNHPANGKPEVFNGPSPATGDAFLERRYGMKVTVTAVRDLLSHLGFAKAKTYNKKILQDRMDQILDIVEKDQEVDDEDANSLLKDILSATKKKQKVTVVEDEEEEGAPVKKGKEKTPPPKKGKPKKEEPEEEEEEEEESESEEEEEEPEEEEDEDEEEEDEKPVKKKGKVSKEKEKTKKKSGNAGPGPRVGIVSCIRENLEKASKTNPLTKEAMLKILKKKFPDRAEKDDGKGMAHTVYVQLYTKDYGLESKGVNITRTDKGCYISKPKKS